MNSGTSKGNQSKYVIDDNFIKVDSVGCCESVSEVLVSELQHNIVNAYPFVDYSFYTYKGLNSCICKNFLKDGESCVSLYSLLKGYNIPFNGGEDLKNAVVGLMNMVYGIDTEYYLSYMIYLDAIALNEDRHLRNIAFILSRDGALKPTPIFDYGLSLLSDKVSYADWEKSVKDVKSQPFCNDFKEQVMLFENPDIRIKYDKLRDKLLFAYNNTELFVNSSQKSDLKRGINILLYQLKNTEGILWKRA